MPLRFRITLLIVVLLSVSMVGNTMLLVLLGKESILQRTEGDGIAIARLLANGVALAERIASEAQARLGRQMIAEAALAAQLIDLAQQHGLAETALNARLAEIVARTSIRRIVALDNDGTIRAEASPAYDPLLPGEKYPALADTLAETAAGKQWAQTTEPLTLPGDYTPLRFAGVRAVRGDGLVVVGQDVEDERGLRRQVGPERNISAMVGEANIESIWIFGENEELLARASLDNNAAGGTGVSNHERAVVRRVIRAGQPHSAYDGNVIRVVVPVLDNDRLPIGATLVRFSTEEVHAMVRRNSAISVALTLTVLVIGVIVADMLGRRISRPIVAIADAARSVHSHTYDAGALSAIVQRSDEIGSLARDFDDMAHQVLAREEELDRLVALRTQQLNERNQELTQAIDVIQTDLDAARSLQHAILPQQFPIAPNFAGVAIMTAARHVGGDFYDFFMIDDDHLAVVIADVSGKGVPAALFMAVSRTILRAQAMATPPPAECIRRANEQICAQNPMYLFITVFYGVLNIRTGEFRYVNAGHPLPVLLQHRARRITPLPGTDGTALGVMEDLAYREDAVALSPGDTLVLYTDGVSEAMDEADNEFTDARILTALEGQIDSEVGAILGHLIEDVQQFVKTAPQSDDLTCVVMRYLGDPAAAELPIPALAS